MPLRDLDFSQIRKLVYDSSAIVLSDSKRYLVESRLAPVARAEGFDTIAQLAAKLKGSASGPLRRKVVNALTTNETSFFRDQVPFEALRDSILPEVIGKRRDARELSIWCGAASSGQEPYSILMLLRENFPELAVWNVRFLATDICSDVLFQARAGRYSQLEVSRGLPPQMLVKYFVKSGAMWEINPDLRSGIDFREMNLIDTWQISQPVDIVFLRNVLIYFDTKTKKEVLSKVRRILKPDGYLFLGGAETTMNVDSGFERVQLVRAGCYRLRDEPEINVAC